MQYKAEKNPTWRLIEDEPAPKNTKVLLLSKWGVATIGSWYDEGCYVAWCPLPKLNDEQKERLK